MKKPWGKANGQFIAACNPAAFGSGFCHGYPLSSMILHMSDIQPFHLLSEVHGKRQRRSFLFIA